MAAGARPADGFGDVSLGGELAYIGAMRACRYLRSLTALAAAYALVLQPLFLTASGLAVAAGPAVTLCIHDGPAAPTGHPHPCRDCASACLAAACCAAVTLPGTATVHLTPAVSPVPPARLASGPTFASWRFAHPARAPPEV